MNKKAMFDFVIELKKDLKENNDVYSKTAWLTARAMIEEAGLWEEWKKYIADINNY